MQVELDGKPITLLKKGSYFGELALLRDMRRTASVRVVSETCDLFVLTKVRHCNSTNIAHIDAMTPCQTTLSMCNTGHLYLHAFMN